LPEKARITAGVSDRRLDGHSSQSSAFNPTVNSRLVGEGRRAPFAGRRLLATEKTEKRKDYVLCVLRRPLWLIIGYTIATRYKKQLED
jgi:hypothetical protein